MGLSHSPRIVTNGLVIALDAGNTKSYPGSGTTWKNIATEGSFGDATLKTGGSLNTYSSNNGGYFSLPRAYITNPGSSPFTTFTYSVWCRTPNLSSYQSMIDQENDNFLFALLNDDLMIYDPTVSVPNSSFTAAVDTWYNFVATHTHTGPISFYVDGELVHTTSSSYSDSHNFTQWSFGAGSVDSSGDGNEEWDGFISSISIYNRSLTAAEVKQNYDALKGRYAFTPTLVQDGLVLNLDAGDTNSYSGSGTTWTDLSGNSNNGTLTNGPTFDSGNGGSIVFDGTNDYVSETSGLSDSFLQGDWTISFWVNFDVISTNNTGRILLQHGSNSTRRGLHLEQRNSSVMFGLYSDDLSGSQTLSTGTWYNITFTLNSTTRLQQIFIDGSLDNSRTANGAYVGTGSNTRIGGRALSFSSYLDGKISNVVAYNRVLSAQEISQNYNILKGRY